jgi:hypothetical protein
MLLTIFGFLCGAVLSFRFDVRILLPATLLGWLLAFVGGLLTVAPVLSILTVMAMLTVALQLGYMFGICMQWGARWSSRQHAHEQVADVETAPRRAL